MAYCHEQLYILPHFVQSMLLLYFKQNAVGRVVRETLQLTIGKYPREYVRMHILITPLTFVFLDGLQILTLFDLFEFLIDHQLSQRFYFRTLIGFGVANVSQFLDSYWLLNGDVIDRLFAINFFCEIVRMCDIDSNFNIPIPLFKLRYVVSAQVETLKLRPLHLHNYLHHPTEVLLILRFTNTETTQRVLTQMLRKHLQCHTRQPHLPPVPLPDHRLTLVQLRLPVLQLLPTQFGERPVELLYPAKIQCDLLLLTFLADFLPEVDEFLRWFAKTFLVLDLLVGSAYFVLHVCELGEVVSVLRLVGGDFDESMENAGHV